MSGRPPVNSSKVNGPDKPACSPAVKGITCTVTGPPSRAARVSSSNWLAMISGSVPAPVRRRITASSRR
jgi:hypothetical protein